MVKKASKNKMWGGRFSLDSSKLLQNVNSSIEFDYKLFEVDVEASIAHTQMLAHCKIITKKDSEAIKEGLLIIQSEIENGTFEYSKALEDIHMNIESRLKEIIGKKLHTGRSRNDQVATDMKLFLRDASDQLVNLIKKLQQATLAKAENNNARFYSYANRTTNYYGPSSFGLCGNAI